MVEYNVANVKVSLKTSKIFLDNVFTLATEKNIFCKNYKNFIVLKSRFTYIIFKSKEKQSESHINITKIRSVSKILEAIDSITSLILCTVISYKIDNIIATTNLKRNLNLSDISKTCNFKNLKYNNEKFPGLFVKFETGTVILFHSGKLVIVGCKTEKDISCLIQKICAHILIV
jgi:TATA-box binding protein (TBP) (component of TFIID and TFIIIB)